MKLSEYIKLLQELEKKYPNIELAGEWLDQTCCPDGIYEISKDDIDFRFYVKVEEPDEVYYDDYEGYNGFDDIVDSDTTPTHVILD